MKVYKAPVKPLAWANQVKVAKTKEGRWLIVRGANWTELPADSFENWNHALWTGIAWANEEYKREIEYAEADAVWHLQHSAAEKRGAAETI